MLHALYHNSPLVVPPGFEPGLRVSKTPVRPLHHGTAETPVLYQILRPLRHYDITSTASAPRLPADKNRRQRYLRLRRDHGRAAHLTRGVPPLEAAHRRSGLKVAVLFLCFSGTVRCGRPSPSVSAPPRPAVCVRCPRHGTGPAGRHGRTRKWHSPRHAKRKAHIR